MREFHLGVTKLIFVVNLKFQHIFLIIIHIDLEGYNSIDTNADMLIKIDYLIIFRYDHHS